MLMAAPALWLAGRRKLPALAPEFLPSRPVVQVLSGDLDGRPIPPIAAPQFAELNLHHDCGAWNEPGAAFCKRCGRAVFPRACPSCLAWNDPDAQFCRGCGSPMVVMR